MEFIWEKHLGPYGEVTIEPPMSLVGLSRWAKGDGADMGVSMAMGTPKTLDGFCSGQSHLYMDVDWGFHYFRISPHGRISSLNGTGNNG